MGIKAAREQQRARKLPSAWQRQALEFGAPELAIKHRVVGYHGRAANEAGGFSHNGGDRGRALDHGVGDSGELSDLGGNMALRVHEALVAADNPPGVDENDGYLRRPIPHAGFSPVVSKSMIATVSSLMRLVARRVSVVGILAEARGDAHRPISAPCRFHAQETPLFVHETRVRLGRAGFIHTKPRFFVHENHAKSCGVIKEEEPKLLLIASRIARSACGRRVANLAGGKGYFRCRRGALGCLDRSRRLGAFGVFDENLIPRNRKQTTY